MNQTAPQILKRPSLVTSHAIVAKLNLENQEQRELYELIRRFHTGRWPLFRALGMRQIDGTIVEVVQWIRMATESYSVVWWRADGLGLSWKETASAKEALALLKSLESCSTVQPHPSDRAPSAPQR